MMDYFAMFATPEQMRKREEASRASIKRRIERGPILNWSDSLVFQKELLISAASWHPLCLFPVNTLSPSGAFEYQNRLVPYGDCLDVHVGKRHGIVAFDGPVRVPWLKEVHRDKPWMSLTPFPG